MPRAKKLEAPTLPFCHPKNIRPRISRMRAPTGPSKNEYNKRGREEEEEEEEKRLSLGLRRGDVCGGLVEPDQGVEWGEIW